MNTKDILKRFKEVNVVDLFYTKKEVKELPKVLRSDETIMYATSGFMDGNTWLITCTDRRVLFLDKGLIYGLKQVDIPIEKINSISHKKGLILGSIIIHHGSDSHEIKNIQKQTLNPMAAAINNEIEKNRRINNNNNSTSSNGYSAADEILKYKELFDNGIITEGDFDKKKNELLNA